MSDMICKWCGKNRATSREHVEANTRIKLVNIHKGGSEKDNNFRKTFKGITCNDCNTKKLKEYEEINPIMLSYVTIWKLLAGNVNNVFNNQKCYQIKNTDSSTIANMMGQVKSAIETYSFLPDNTFFFNIDLSIAKPENGPFFSTWSISPCVDESGSPLEGVNTLITGTHVDDLPLRGTSKFDGTTEGRIASVGDILRVITEKITIRNMRTDDIVKKDIDFIIHCQFTSERGRSLVIIPLIGIITTPWVKEKCSIYYEYLDIMKKNFPELGIVSLEPYEQIKI